MRNIDDTGLLIASYQADLFEKSRTELNCSSAYFFKKFANSKLAKRIDRKAFICECLDVPAAFEELKKETDLSRGREKVSDAILAWIGYLTRYWAYTYEISTKRIYKLISFSELCELFEAYHSLDIEESIKRINEAHKIKYLGDYGYKREELLKLI